MRFSEQALERFLDSRHHGIDFTPSAVGLGGSLETQRFVFIGLLCGDNRVVRAGFRTFNCVAVVASADWVCERIEGATLDEGRHLTAATLLGAIGPFPTTRLFCADLAILAVSSALESAYQGGHLT